MVGLPLLTAADTDPGGSASDLLRELAENRPAELFFEEERDVRMVESTMHLEGWVRFEPPDTLIREVREPFDQRLVIAGEHVTVIEDGRVEQQLHRDDDPGLDVLVRFLMALHGRGIEDLESHFEMVHEGDADGWRVTLKPSGRAERRRIRQIILRGADAWLETVEIQETNGDNTLTRFSRP